MNKLSKIKPLKGSYRIEMPTGDPDSEALRSFMLECVVPLLAEEFMKHRTVMSRVRIQVNEENPTSQLLVKEGGL